MKCVVLVATCVTLAVSASPAYAQKGVGNREGPTTVGLYGGSYTTGNGEWPRIAFDVDQGFGAFVARAEVWAVSRPVVLCSGISLPECDERKWIRALVLGARLIDRKGDWHPYIGAGGGVTKYYHTGSQVYGELGMRFDVTAKLGLDLRASAEVLGEAGEIGGARSINLGVWYAVAGRPSGITGR